MFSVRQITVALCVAVASAMALASPALAGDDRNRSAHLSVFGSVWAEGSLVEIPVDAVTADLDLRDAYFVGFAGSLVLLDNFDVPIALPFFQGMDIEFEIQALQHFDLQDHTEGTFAFIIRSGQVNITDDISFNVAAGDGFSYAFSEPDYERGSQGPRGVDVNQFLNYLLFEIEWTHADLEQLHLVARAHHRSGVFGLIGDTRLGSNFLGLGLRYDIE